MPAIPPPLNAVALLRDSQVTELAQIPLSNRRVAAWLILLRDDDTCLWRERDVPCTECGGRWPCIDSASRSHGVFGRCQNCHYNNLLCEEGRLEDPAAVPSQAIGVSQATAPTSRSMRSLSAPGSYLSGHLQSAAITERSESDVDAAETPREAPEAPQPVEAPATPQLPSANMYEPSISATGDTYGAIVTWDSVSSPAADWNFVPRPVYMRSPATRVVSAPLPPPSFQQSPSHYDYTKVLSVLRKVRQRYGVQLVEGDPRMTLRLAPESKHVKVLCPRIVGASWAVLVFNAHLGVIYHAEEHNQAIQRAQTVGGPDFWYAVPHAGLCTADGGVQAATIAVWFLNKSRLRFPTRFTIDVRKARIEHAMLERGQRPDFVAMRTISPTAAFERR